MKTEKVISWHIQSKRNKCQIDREQLKHVDMSLWSHRGRFPSFQRVMEGYNMWRREGSCHVFMYLAWHSPWIYISLRFIIEGNFLWVGVSGELVWWLKAMSALFSPSTSKLTFFFLKSVHAFWGITYGTSRLYFLIKKYSAKWDCKQSGSLSRIMCPCALSVSNHFSSLLPWLGHLTEHHSRLWNEVKLSWSHRGKWRWGWVMWGERQSGSLGYLPTLCWLFGDGDVIIDHASMPPWQLSL